MYVEYITIKNYVNNKIQWGRLCPPDEQVCFSGIKTYVFLRKKLPFFHFILRRIFSKEKQNIRIRMFFDAANFIAEFFWRASSPVWWDTILVSLIIPSHTSSSSKSIIASEFLGELWCFVVLIHWGGAIWIFGFTSMSFSFVSLLSIIFLCSHQTHHPISTYYHLAF